MTYKIRKLPNSNKYRVYKEKNDRNQKKEIMAKATTLKKAKAQIRLLNAIDHNPKFYRNKTKKKIFKFNGGESIKELLDTKLKYTEKRISNVLDKVCKDPVFCIALGNYYNHLKSYMNQFNDLKLIVNNKIELIGKGNNGFVLKIQFKRPESEYTAYTLMKCTKSEYADNLYYEYYIGKEFVNHICTKLPAFLETYNIYRLSSDDWSKLEKTKKGMYANFELDKMLSKNPKPTDVKSSCIENKYLCILTQYFDHLRPLADYLDFGKTNNFNEIRHDMFGLMYQIYFALTCLAPHYTHYDLHSGNVLLYKPYDNKKKYMVMNYHLKSGRTITFPTEYLCKIIDYGRNYIDLEGKNKPGSSDIIKEMCNTEECGDDCGTYKGYYVISATKRRMLESYITPNQYNNAHDLRLIQSIRIPEFGETVIDSDEVKLYLNKYHEHEVPLYNNYFQKYCNIIYKDEYGTPNVDVTEHSTDSKVEVRTISDARYMLEKHIDEYVSNETYPLKYADWEKAAVINVYEDGRDYEFIEENSVDIDKIRKERRKEEYQKKLASNHYTRARVRL